MRKIDLLEHISLADGEAYNNNLMPIARGDILPHRTIPVEYIIYNLWESIGTKLTAFASFLPTTYSAPLYACSGRLVLIRGRSARRTCRQGFWVSVLLCRRVDLPAGI
jgi:hypothetical protein